MRTSLFILGLALSAGAASAEPADTPEGIHYYPTTDTVTMVINCMHDLGGQSEELLYTCSCRHDIIASKLSYNEFETGSLYLRYKNMPGEKGGVFRDAPNGKEMGARLQQVRAQARQACPLVQHLESPRLQEQHKEMMEKAMEEQE